MNRLSILRWFGGKHYQINKILPFPKHKSYIELFGGGGSILLNKIPSRFEIYNDINKSLVNFWNVFRNDYHLFRLLLFCLPKSQTYFNKLVNKDYEGLIPEFMKNMLKDIDTNMVEEAISFYYKNRYSFSGGNHSYIGLHVDSLYMVPSKIETIGNFLQSIWNRIRDVQFTCRDYRDILKMFDRKQILYYLDPPYFEAGKAYLRNSENNELWIDKNFIELNDCLKHLKHSKFVLSIDNLDFFDNKEWFVEKIKQVSFTSRKSRNIKNEYIIRNFDNEKMTKMSRNTSLSNFI